MENQGHPGAELRENGTFIFRMGHTRKKELESKVLVAE